MIMKKNPQIVQICEKFDIENQKDELLSALKRLCGSGDDLDSSDDDNQSNPNTVAGVKILFLIKNLNKFLKTITIQ